LSVPARRAVAIALARAAGQASRLLRRGGGTTLPGVVARFVDPGVTRQLGAQLEHGSVLVSGTNGKTTTTRLVSAVLGGGGRRLIHNRAGANLMSGITTALLQGSGDTGLFEVDEANLPAAIAELRPKLVLCLNLFRDQLDRYGELNTLGSKWAGALAGLSPDATVLLNADDPLVASLGRGLPCRVAYFGLDSPNQQIPTMQHAADSIYCPTCGGLLTFGAIYYGHLGHYTCRDCSFGRPNPAFVATDVCLALDAPTSFRLGDLRLKTALPGLYNVYNVLAAAAAGVVLGVTPQLISQAVGTFAGAFGRTETVEIDGKRLRLLLAKNPVSFNELIRTLRLDPTPLHLYLALNDRIADGEDVSWIWDVDLGQLAGRCASVLVGGTRAEDMAVRLKYAGFPAAAIQLAPDHATAVRQLLAGTPAGATAYVIPTYTAMLDLRRILAAAGAVRQFWKD
jgi:lipid II isoglutaminyl synthase (glutamine-hydrolysing)